MLVFYVLPKVFREYLKFKDWRNFLNSSNELTDVKHTTVYYNLTHEFSMLYYSDAKFRELVDGKIENPGFQLSLNLACFSYLKDLTLLSKVHSLSSPGCSISDVSSFSQIKILNLSYCDRIKDVRPLGNALSLDLSHCKRIGGFSALKNVKYLNLSGCQQLTNDDLHSFTNTRYLNISCCPLITDIAPLKDVSILYLYDCYNLADIRPLGGQKELNIAYCSKINDLSSLSAVKVLDISGLLLVEDISPLKALEVLTITSRQQIQGVSELQNLKKIRVNHLSVEYQTELNCFVMISSILESTPAQLEFENLTA
jgi:hypothetical protein